MSQVSAWQQKLETAVTAILKSPSGTMERIFDALKEHCILDRIAPTDPVERQARTAKRKVIWEGDRQDPELYWRIMYAAASAQYATDMNWTLCASGNGYVIGAISEYWGIILREQVPDWLREFTNHHQRSLLRPLTDDLIRWSKTTLMEMGQTPHQTLIPIGSRGIFHDIPVSLSAYTDQGLICFEADDYNDHCKLYQHLDPETRIGVVPSNIDPAAFSS